MTTRPESASFSRNRRAVLAALSAGAALKAVSARATEESAFPNKPVRIIVPSVPGGIMDSCARLIAPKLSGYWNVPVIVEDRPGAGMAIGTQFVARSPADGYTLLLSYQGAIVINPMLVAGTAYSPADFVALAEVWETSVILVVNKDVPATTLPELDRYIKKNPGKLNYAIADTLGELMSNLLKQEMHWNYVNIMYKGNGERLRSVMAGETQLTLASASDAAAAIATGRVRPIGISSLARSVQLPTIPTLDELGMKGFQLMSWGGLFSPAGTPPAIVKKISADARRALAEPDVVQTIEAGGSQVGHLDREAFNKFIAKDIALWRGIAERSGMEIYDR